MPCLVYPTLYSQSLSLFLLYSSFYIDNESREEEELMFLDLILSKHTKKNAAWSHRKWCLGRRFFSLGEKSSLVLWGKGLIDHELDVTAKVMNGEGKRLALVIIFRPYMCCTHLSLSFCSLSFLLLPSRSQSFIQRITMLGHIDGG